MSFASRHKNKGSAQGPRFPDRWENYSNVGQVMEKARFVAFRCPLKNAFFVGKSTPPFQIADVVEDVRSQGKELGLVVDLTNTDRYYDRHDWAKYHVQYEKIYCEGHSLHNQSQNIKQFQDVVNRFFASNRDSNVIVGVHCTHGVNRTGYIICHYMVENMNWNPYVAVAEFEVARGHRIERIDYVKAVHELKPLLNSKANHHNHLERKSNAIIQNTHQVSSARYDEQAKQYSPRQRHSCDDHRSSAGSFYYV